MTETKPYIAVDEKGVMRVGESGVPMDSVIAGFEQGQTPENIRSQYPSLSLEEVYGAITYYLAHRNEVDEYLVRQDALWEHWRQKLQKDDPPVVKRLRAIRESFGVRRHDAALS